uniref:Uncharacterized protein n=1 Tax=Mus musculus TaxID=10090 RepID=Q8C8T4_MOUSE|nr:unnamed protein product [Mus musculus]
MPLFLMAAHKTHLNSLEVKMNNRSQDPCFQDSVEERRAAFLHASSWDKHLWTQTRTSSRFSPCFLYTVRERTLSVACPCLRDFLPNVHGSKASWSEYCMP